jgi:hypothetical protein
VLEPGRVDDLGPRGRSAWSELVEGCLSRYRGRHPESHFVLDHGDRETAVTASDWIGYPVRVEACLGRERALAGLDPPAAAESGGSPPRALQEEYIEWRIVSDTDEQAIQLMVVEGTDWDCSARSWSAAVAG